VQLPFQVDSAVTAAAVIAERLPETLSPTAKTLYQVLVAASVETAKGKGYSPNITHMTLHAPLEQVARAIGLSRVTVWRYLPELKALGLVDWRTHKGTCRGVTRNTGTVWQVRLTPTCGRGAKLSYQDLKHKWRPNFDSEVRAKRTSFSALKHTETANTNTFNLDKILVWTLNQTYKTPVKASSSVCKGSRKPELENVLDVTHAPKNERNAAVRLGAEALASALNDKQSTNFYQKLLWSLLRHRELTGQDYSYSVYLAAQRARTDASEGFAKRAGALFHSRLKKAGWFEEVMNSPPILVGTRPLES
jgi:hypothetical protein